MGRASNIRGGNIVPVLAGLLALCALVTGGMALLLDGSPLWFYATIAMLVGSALAGLGSRVVPLRDGWSVVLDTEGVYAEHVLGTFRQEGRVPWSELAEVGIVTTSRGRSPADFHWVLLGEGDSGCVVPLGLAEEVGLFADLTKLPGFDHDAVVLACCSTTDAAFRCWSGGSGTKRVRGRSSVDSRPPRMSRGPVRAWGWSEALASYVERVPSTLA